MDALDAYIEPATAGTLETATATTSKSHLTQLPDDEDLKSDIPYVEDQQAEQKPPHADKEGVEGADAVADGGDDNPENFDSALLPFTKTECELSDYTSWDEVQDASDENYMDDSGSVLGSDYSSPYTANSCSTTSYYQKPKQPNGDLLLRPPSHTSFHYSYPSPLPPRPQPGPQPHSPVLQLQLQPPGSNSGRLHATYAHSQPTHCQLPGFYPNANMWYPNAPFNVSAGGSNDAGGQPDMYVGYAHGAYGSPYAGHPSHMHSHHPHHAHHPHTHPHPHHQHPHSHPHETMMEMFQLSNSGREARNRAEKNRRDKLNGSIQELSTMVPHVAESPRRVDKTAVLRFAAHGLRLKYAFGKTLQHQRPQITDTLMNMLDSFFVTLTCHGQILLISSSIEQHLGHCQTDLYGQNILQITHPEDHSMLKQQLIPTELENLFEAHAEGDVGDGETRQRSKSEEEYIDRKLREDKRSFRVRLARAGPRSEPTAYEVVKIDGCFRRSDEAPRGKSSTFSSSLQLIRRSRGRDDTIPLHSISGNDIVLTACARIIRPPKIASRLIDANALEYRTRHLIDGRIIDCDQRIGIVAGYMTDEVRNLSPFTFMHNDDVRWVIVALRQMYDCNSSYGESTYRLFTRNGNIIYLQSKGFLEIDKETNKVHSFVCVNTLLDEEEGKRRVQEMKKKFSVIINTKIPQSTMDVPASEHPAQLEKAVLCLIQNLQKTATHEYQEGDDDDEDDEIDDEDDNDDGDGDGEDADDDNKTVDKFSDDGSASHRSRHHHHQRDQPPKTQHQKLNSLFLGSSLSMSHARMAAAQNMASSKTPPLALVPPETASVKSSISKSVTVVNFTAAKHLRGPQQSVKSPSAMSTLLEGCNCQTGSEIDCDFCQSQLAREAPSSASGAATSTTATVKRTSIGDADDVKPSKRIFMPSLEIEHVLSNSLVQIERTLNQQLNVAKELRDQGNRFEVPNANQRIDEIMEEHQKQSELYVNIKSEYEVQLQNKGHTTKSESDPHGSNTSGEEHLTPR
ncbi:uncharacterized protein LOC115627149 [Scaptodrosophila lebanonensis]|uniref:Uncharacterized protein LOC115627149 n=1 Tax=Drosophila lebanonensis TaxID=7225 RepID=A0A6J2TUK2_DROLE|nr:uncharacterized protein LOC115627149 [Scaptodrosophila lebanonensis]